MEKKLKNILNDKSIIIEMEIGFGLYIVVQSGGDIFYKGKIVVQAIEVKDNPEKGMSAILRITKLSLIKEILKEMNNHITDTLDKLDSKKKDNNDLVLKEILDSQAYISIKSLMSCEG